MAYTTEQAEKLKKYVKDIIDDSYVSILHELRKKLSIAQSRDKEQTERLDRFEKELEIYKKCHECHRINTEMCDKATQFPEIGKPENRDCVMNQLKPIEDTPPDEPQPGTSQNNKQPQSTKEPVRIFAPPLEMGGTTVPVGKTLFRQPVPTLQSGMPLGPPVVPVIMRYPHYREPFRPHRPVVPDRELVMATKFRSHQHYLTEIAPKPQHLIDLPNPEVVEIDSDD